MNTPEALTKVFSLAAISFVLAMALTPVLTKFLYKYKMGKQIRKDGDTPVFSQLHEKKRGTPTMGGILIWFTTILLALAFWFFDRVAGWEFFHNLNFLTRQQTLLPMGVLLASALLGLLDDYLGIRGIGSAKGGGLRSRQRLLLYGLVAAVGAYWFYYKLEFDMLYVPFVGNLSIGWWYIPLFIFVVIATSHSTNLTDGLDGLAGGVLATMFFAYGIIAFNQGRFELAALTAVIGGALLAFLWFNIYPARFFMGDTGSMSLGTVLAVIAFLTNSVLILPIVGIILVMESGSVIVQLSSRRLRGKKVFLSAPIHHHFEAVGWPETKVTMRFWVVSAVAAMAGVAIDLLGR